VFVPPELKELHPRPGLAVVEVLGEHDLSTSDAALDVFTRLVSANDLIIDLTDTQFIDSSFLSTLFRAKATADDQGHMLLLQIERDTDVGRLLAMTQTLRAFDHVSTRDEALAWSAGQAGTAPAAQEI
jgi:anti-anti-sigma factor